MAQAQSSVVVPLGKCQGSHASWRAADSGQSTRPAREIRGNKTQTARPQAKRKPPTDYIILPTATSRITAESSDVPPFVSVVFNRPNSVCKISTHLIYSLAPGKDIFPLLACFGIACITSHSFMERACLLASLLRNLYMPPSHSGLCCIERPEPKRHPSFQVLSTSAVKCGLASQCHYCI